MKLRFKDSSLRFRITQSDLANLIDTGRIEKTIYFAADENAGLTYALEHQPSSICATLRYQAPELTVVLSTAEVRAWGSSDQVGIYATVDLGAHGSLNILVEKDYACVDLSDADNHDTFPNPGICAVSQ
jgi:hypothetical protein